MVLFFSLFLREHILHLLLSTVLSLIFSAPLLPPLFSYRNLSFSSGMVCTYFQFSFPSKLISTSFYFDLSFHLLLPDFNNPLAYRLSSRLSRCLLTSSTQSVHGHTDNTPNNIFPFWDFFFLRYCTCSFFRPIDFCFYLSFSTCSAMRHPNVIVSMAYRTSAFLPVVW